MGGGKSCRCRAAIPRARPARWLVARSRRVSTDHVDGLDPNLDLLVLGQQSDGELGRAHVLPEV